MESLTEKSLKSSNGLLTSLIHHHPSQQLYILKRTFLSKELFTFKYLTLLSPLHKTSSNV